MTKVQDRIFFAWRLIRLMDKGTGRVGFRKLSVKDLKNVGSKFEMLFIDAIDSNSVRKVLDEEGYYIASYYWAGLFRFYPEIKEFALKIQTADQTILTMEYIFNYDDTVTYFSTLKNKWENRQMIRQDFPA